MDTEGAEMPLCGLDLLSAFYAAGFRRNSFPTCGPSEGTEISPAFLGSWQPGGLGSVLKGQERGMGAWTQRGRGTACCTELRGL